MANVRVQFFTILDGELTREKFNADGGAQWDQDPPLTVNKSMPAEARATVPNRSTVDFTYYWSQDKVDYFVTITETNNVVTAKGSANKDGHDLKVNVTGQHPNFIVAVQFK